MIDVDKLAFDNSPMIETLNELEISHNLLESIPDLSGLRNLTSIILSSNYIQRIPAGYFESGRNLGKFNLSGNFLNKLKRDSFADLDN
uniref:Chaoptin n=1 Tax=Romanomermis culicivorax TaxID=13658 RepID=A0A915KG58_ROMCU